MLCMCSFGKASRIRCKIAGCLLRI